MVDGEPVVLDILDTAGQEVSRGGPQRMREKERRRQRDREEQSRKETNLVF